MPKSPSSQFYAQLKSFSDFADLLNPVHYAEIPHDWWILITDIRGSTKAIQEGKYKQVNMLGAACITCVLNINRELDLPYVFGGDGATLLVPDLILKETLEELSKLQRLAKKSFQMELRVGAVSLSSPELTHATLKVAKYELSPGNYISQFRGSAITLAEELVKGNSPEAKILDYIEGDSNVNLKGLSCRIAPVVSKNGEMLSLLCKSKGEDGDQTLNEIIYQIRTIFNHDFRSANPAGLDRMNWDWPHSTLNEEVLLHRNGKPIWLQWVITFIRSFISNHSLKYNLKMGSFLPSKYKSEVIMNCDFKKYDETLRMVIDCTPEQISKIESLLEKYSAQKKIAYGLHRSREALITCMVFSPTQNRHTHFIDGANGGYAFAAIAFKKALKK